jgi:hypothetical protein
MRYGKFFSWHSSELEGMSDGLDAQRWKEDGCWRESAVRLGAQAARICRRRRWQIRWPDHVSGGGYAALIREGVGRVAWDRSIAGRLPARSRVARGAGGVWRKGDILICISGEEGLNARGGGLRSRLRGQGNVKREKRIERKIRSFCDISDACPLRSAVSFSRRPSARPSA